MNEEERRENSKKFRNFFLGMILVLGCAFGGYQWYMYRDVDKPSGNYKNDNSYKVITSKDKSYDGVYTLTKLDEKGKNTWDGLIMYVNKDKIVSAVLCNYLTVDDLKKTHPKYIKDDITFDELFTAFTSPMIWEDYKDDAISDDDYLYKEEMKCLEQDLGAYTGFSAGSSDFLSSSTKQKAIVYGQARCVYYNKKVNLENDYKALKKMGLVSGYDEKSGEIWLSKLLKNKNSQYKDGYKLKRYKDNWDMFDNCELDDGSCMAALNEQFNANLKYER